MVLAVGLSKYDVSLFHVINHAFFKALLFLSAGSVIHSMADQQDVRRLGGLINFLPFTYTIMLIGSLSLLATTWLTGFYSKDLIIELGYAQYQFSGYYAYILGSITAGLTAFYSFRLISLTFLTYPNATRNDYLNSHEANLKVVVPLTVLALFSIFFGYICSDLFVGIGSDFLGNSIFIHPDHITLVEAEFSLPSLMKLLPAIFSLVGAILGLVLYHVSPEFIVSLTDPNISTSAKKDSHISSEISFISNVRESVEERVNKVGLSKLYRGEGSLFRKVYLFLNSKFLFDILYNNYIISRGLKTGYIISKVLDKGLIEIVGPYGLSIIGYKTGLNISKLDTGVVTTYSLYISLGLLTLLFLVFSPLYFGENSYSDLMNYICSVSQPFQPDRLFILYFSSLLLISFPSRP